MTKSQELDGRLVEVPFTSGEHLIQERPNDEWNNDFFSNEATTVGSQRIPVHDVGNFGTYLAAVILFTIFVSIPIGLYLYKR